MATRFPIATVNGDFAGFRRAFEPFFNDAFGTQALRGSRAAFNGARSIVPLDVFTRGDDIIVLAAVPGVSPEAIQISVEKNVVTLSGAIANAADADEAKDSTWYLHELPSGSFKRSLKLPFEVDADRAEATFANGTLRLTLPKLESAKPRQIQIKVSEVSPAPIADSATGSTPAETSVAAE